MVARLSRSEWIIARRLAERTTATTRAKPIHARRPRLRGHHHPSLLRLLETGLHRLLLELLLLLLRRARELLLVEERVVASLIRVELVQTLTGAVDEGTGCGVLGRDA